MNYYIKKGETKVMCYIYRFKDSYDQIIYVGKTKSLKSRMTQHFSSQGHLPSECYEGVAKLSILNV